MSLFRHDDPIMDRAQRVSLPEPTRRSVAAWLAELPLANTSYCFDALLGALEFFNARLDLSSSLRLELAELLRPSARIMMQRAEVHCADAPLPYSGEVEAYLHRGLDLCRELEQAYTRACFDPLGFGGRGKGERELAQALFRSFQQAGLSLLWTAQLYQMPDEEYWWLLYRLYRLAETRNLLHVRFEDAEEPEPCRTALGLFKRCLLFFVAGPGRLRQRDMSQVFALLGRLGDNAHFGATAAHDGHPADFFLDLDSFQPPLRSQAITDSNVSSGLRFLFTLTLAQSLFETARISGDVTSRNVVDRASLVSIVRNLGAEQKRKSKRRDEFGSRRYIIGLPAIMDALSSCSDQWPQSQSGCPNLADRRLELLPEDTSGSVRQGFEGKSLRNEVGLIGGQQGLSKLSRAGRAFHSSVSSEEIWYGGSMASSTANADDSTYVIEGKVINSSPDGYCIVWPPGPTAQIKVGGGIGVWEGSSLFIGVIRWLECKGSRGGWWRFGVELLAQSAHVVELCDDAFSSKGKALLLPIDPPARPTPELLVLPGGMQSGDVVYARCFEGEATRYMVRKLLEATPSFARFGVVEMGVVKMAAKSKPC